MKMVDLTTANSKDLSPFQLYHLVCPAAVAVQAAHHPGVVSVYFLRSSSVMSISSSTQARGSALNRE